MEQTQLTDEQRRLALQCLLTEHSALQSARGTTIAEANGRVGNFLATVSSALIALGFVAQGSIASDAFLVFGLFLFPVLFFLGAVAFRRVLEASIEDIHYGMAINRIRHFYLEIAPQAQDYFMMSSHDDPIGVLKNMGLPRSRWQFYLADPLIVGVINSVILSALAVLFTVRVVSLPIATGIAVGAILFVASAVLHQRFQVMERQASMQDVKVRFPSEPGP